MHNDDTMKGTNGAVPIPHPPPPPTKAEAITQALASLADVRWHLMQLRGRIHGTEEPRTVREDADFNQPLCVVLNQTPATIEEFTGAMHEMIAEIENDLF
jgi:hypothetical protein